MNLTSSSFSSALFDLQHLLFYVFFPAIFYLNLGWLFPRWYLNKKYSLYFATMIVLLVAVAYLKPFDALMRSTRNAMPAREFRLSERSGIQNGFERFDPPPRGENNAVQRSPGGAFGPGPGFAGNRPFGSPGPAIDIMSVILFILTWSVSTGVGVFRQWRNTEQRALKAEADRARAELSFLKAQVNPHFLFNTLNNIYSMAVTKNPATAESIMKLSNIMRYITDEVSENFVDLEDEIACLRDYIDLQRIRLGKVTTVNFSVDGDPGLKKIAPLLLMTFVENAFKYGTSNHEPATIEVFIFINEKSVRFLCRNKKFQIKRNPERTGIGMRN
ncbi:MAG: histidine kinase, partial [Flavitalea sp.]